MHAACPTSSWRSRWPALTACIGMSNVVSFRARWLLASTMFSMPLARRSSAEYRHARATRTTRPAAGGQWEHQCLVW
eukprot:scaffold155768_cov19-Prasinocladus_malaysianus.AAC.1